MWSKRVSSPYKGSNSFLQSVKNSAWRVSCSTSKRKLLVVLAFFLAHVLLPPPDDRIWSDPDQDSRYLLYFTHSGFSNQIVGLEKVAYLALFTNRTLVLPPILPHVGEHSSSTFPDFIGRGAGSKCGPFDAYYNSLSKVEEDVKKAMNPKIPFPSWMEIFDFSELQSAGLKVIDMKDFAQYQENTRRNKWCRGPKNEMRRKIIPDCDRSDKLSFLELVPYFQKTCSTRHHRVAIIGASFVMPMATADKNTLQQIPNGTLVQELFENYKPSKKLLSLVRQMYSKLPAGYTGIHIRFKDGVKIDNCDEPVIKSVYEDVFNNAHMPKDGHVLIGNGNPAAAQCFNHHGNGNYIGTVSTINNIIDSDEALTDTLNGIKMEKGTLYLMLDQILIGMAEQIALAGISASTFQIQIQNWHRRRHTIIGSVTSNGKQ